MVSLEVSASQRDVSVMKPTFIDIKTSRVMKLSSNDHNVESAAPNHQYYVRFMRLYNILNY